MRGSRVGLFLALGACSGGGTAGDAGSDATLDANGGDTALPPHVCTFSVEGAEQADGSCQFAMLYGFGASSDFVALLAGDSGVPGSISVALPRKSAFTPGNFSATDFADLGAAVQFNGAKNPEYSVAVGPTADGSVALQLTSVDPYPTDTNLYLHLLPAPNTHGSLQAVLLASPLYDPDAGQQIPQDATVKLTASF